MDALRRSSRISRKERIRNVTIRQQIGLEEEIEQNQLTWYGHVQRMAEGSVCFDFLYKFCMKYFSFETNSVRYHKHTTLSVYRASYSCQISIEFEYSVGRFSKNTEI